MAEASFSGISLDEYRQRRMRLRAHHNAAVKMVSRTVLMQCAATFGMLQGGKLALQSETEMIILFDYGIYSYRQQGKTVVERYLAKLAPPPDLDEQTVRAAMARPRYSLYQAGKAIPGTGLELHDVVREEQLFVVDQTLSKTLGEGRVLGARLLPFPGYWMTSGAAVPLGDVAAAEIVTVFLPALRATEGSLQTLAPPAETELATVIIGAAMAEGGTTRIEYR